MKTVLKILGYLAAIFGAVAALDVVPFVSSGLGVLIVGLSGGLLMVVKVIGDYLDDKLLNDSFKEDTVAKKVIGFIVGLFKK